MQRPRPVTNNVDALRTTEFFHGPAGQWSSIA